MWRVAGVALLMTVMVGCATNPVTGRSELSMISRAQEIQLGQENYGPMKQSEGGEYTADPALSAYVNEVGQRVAAVSDNPLPYEFVVLNNSIPNAWALPGGKIAINRGLLLELNNEAELAAVLGHEVVHSAARHGAQAMTRGMLLQGALVAGALATMDNQYAPMLLGASQMGAQLITQRYGREAEREADDFGTRYMAEAGYDPRAAVSLQEVFVRLSEGGNQDWLSGLFSSHPPSTERVRNNQRLVNELMPSLEGKDLFLGVEAYQEATASLRQTAPAYEKADEAMGAMARNDLERALSLLDEAIAAAPQEGRFHGLKGDIYLHQGNEGAAVAAFDQAIALDSGYFEYYLGRGLAHQHQGNSQQAQQDLARSANLLPTTVAMQQLGILAQASNDRRAAKQYFEQAATGEGAAAEDAARRFARLDLLDNPGRHVRSDVGINNNSQFVVRVSNSTDVPLRNVRIQVALRVDGRVQQTEMRVDRLAANASASVNTGWVVPQEFSPDRDTIQAAVISVEME